MVVVLVLVVKVVAVVVVPLTVLVVELLVVVFVELVLTEVVEVVLPVPVLVEVVVALVLVLVVVLVQSGPEPTKPTCESSQWYDLGAPAYPGAHATMHAPGGKTPEQLLTSLSWPRTGG